MSLSSQQLQTLKNYIDEDEVLSAVPNNSDGHVIIADAMNLVVSPSFVIWRSEVSEGEIVSDSAFNWTRVDNLSVGKARIWDWMFRAGSSIDPSKANIRAGIDAVWVGTQADLDVRTAVYVHCKHDATRVEKLFATGTGTTNSPATSAFPEGFLLIVEHVDAARNLP